MPTRLRAILSSVPFITVVVLLALYTGLGFFAVPALLKWQGEKQVAEQLGQRLGMGEVRFNPFTLQLEIGDLALADPQGGPLVGFKRLHVDLSAASALERAWVLDALTLDSPLVHFERDKAGRQNFAQLMERIGSDPDSPLPRVVVKRLVIREGRVEFLDRLLDAPLVTRVAPMLIEIENLSTLPGQAAPTRLTGRTEADETIQISGTVTLNPLSLKGTLGLHGVKLATLARALSRQVALDAAAGTIDLAADLDLTFDAQGEPGGGAKNVGVKVSAFSLRAPGAVAPLLAAETFSLGDGRIDLATREIAFGSFKLAKGSAAAAIDAQGRGDWSGFLHEASAEAAASRPAAAPGVSRAVADAKPWKVSIAKAEVAQIAVRFEDAAAGLSAQIASLGLTLSPALELAAQGMRITLGQPKLSLADVKALRGSDQIVLKEARLEAASVRGATNVADGMRVTLDQPKLTLAEVTALQGSDQVVLKEVGLDAASISGATTVAQGTIDADAQALMLRIVSAGVRVRGRAADRVQFDAARAAAGVLTLKHDGAAATPVVSGKGLTLALENTVLRDPANETELLRLASANLSGGALHSGERTLGFDKAVLAKGRAKGWLDAKGALNWASVFAPGPPNSKPANAKPANAKPARAKAQPAWRFRLAQANLEDVALDFEDRRKTPALALGLDAIGLSVAGVDSGAAKPFRVEAKARVRSGGQLEARGQLRIDAPFADLELKFSRIALAPVQPFLSDVSALRLTGGSASAAGRLRYAVPGKDTAKFTWKGGVSLDGVALQEAQSGRPFLAWDSVSAADVLATLEPNRVDIGELRVDKPAGRVIIAADRTVNLLDVLKAPGGNAGAKPAPAAAAAPALSADPFPVAIARVRVAEGTLEFADLSLKPQFGAKMHEVKGVITGLASDRAGSAQLALDARVDKYGSAKIRGRISTADPRKSTDVTLEFRNLEMNALSPYVEKFAGYRITAGRLALDLQYKLRNGMLEGQNKIVLNKVELGEKVDSPGALDLPLDLAFAILKDSDGVIDIGLPISGNLEDPKFDYGAVIAKAFGNLIGGILSAPFRALGALFGGGEKQIDSLDFEPGSDAIAPPERQKLAALARALKERPQLMLKVPSTYAEAADAAAMKSEAVRADILQRMGMTLRAGEDPGPLDASNPRVQGAVEAAFAERHGAAVFSELKSRAQETTPPATASGANPMRVFYRGLIDRLIRDATVTEQALAQLGARRSAGIVRELTTVEGVPAARAVAGAPRKAEGANSRTVTLKLELGVAK